MEKFRKWGDASTGIHPFVFPADAVPMVRRVLHTFVLFPVRLVLAVILLVVLFVVDTMAHTLRVARVAPLASYTLSPLGTVIAKGVLMLLAGGMAARFRVLPPRPITRDDVLKSPKAGDVILCNLQSPIDVLAIRCALPTVFSTGEWAGALDRGAVLAFFDPLNAANGAPIADFCPSPFQLWKASRFVRHLAKPSTVLRMEHAIASSGLGEIPPLAIDTVQRRAMKLGVPVILFAEGSTTNGRAVMPFPRLQIATTGLKKGAAPPQVYLAAVHYPHAPAAACVLDCGSTPLPFLANVCARVEGGGHATFTVARPSAGVDMGHTYASGEDDFVTTSAWLLDCRAKICALVQYRNPGVVCRPVSVGLQEKVGFVKQFLETMK